MKNLIKIVPIIAVMALSSCAKDQTADQLVVEEAVVEAPQMPVQESQEDMIKAAQSKPLTNIVLSESQFDFGKMKKGEQREHIYEITNTGENPLIISQVKPGCGCTVPEFTKEPILPGKKGMITLKFDSSGFDGLQQKQAEVYANVERAPIMLSFTADIQPETTETKTINQ